VHHSLGVKAPGGNGWLTNPRRAAYNRVYGRTTFSLTPAARGRGGGAALGSLAVRIMAAAVSVGRSIIDTPGYPRSRDIAGDIVKTGFGILRAAGAHRQPSAMADSGIDAAVSVGRSIIDTPGYPRSRDIAGDIVQNRLWPAAIVLGYGGFGHRRRRAALSGPVAATGSHVSLGEPGEWDPPH
jgi:hypothetical protein